MQMAYKNLKIFYYIKALKVIRNYPIFIIMKFDFFFFLQYSRLKLSKHIISDIL